MEWGDGDGSFWDRYLAVEPLVTSSAVGFIVSIWLCQAHAHGNLAYIPPLHKNLRQKSLKRPAEAKSNRESIQPALKLNLILPHQMEMRRCQDSRDESQGDVGRRRRCNGPEPTFAKTAGQHAKGIFERIVVLQTSCRGAPFSIVRPRPAYDDERKRSRGRSTAVSRACSEIVFSMPEARGQ